VHAQAGLLRVWRSALEAECVAVDACLPAGASAGRAYAAAAAPLVDAAARGTPAAVLCYGPRRCGATHATLGAWCGAGEGDSAPHTAAPASACTPERGGFAHRAAAQLLAAADAAHAGEAVLRVALAAARLRHDGGAEDALRQARDDSGATTTGGVKRDSWSDAAAADECAADADAADGEGWDAPHGAVLLRSGAHAARLLARASTCVDDDDACAAPHAPLLLTLFTLTRGRPAAEATPLLLVDLPAPHAPDGTPDAALAALGRCLCAHASTPLSSSSATAAPWAATPLTAAIGAVLCRPGAACCLLLALPSAGGAAAGAEASAALSWARGAMGAAAAAAATARAAAMLALPPGAGADNVAHALASRRLSSENDALREENERLRAALQVAMQDADATSAAAAAARPDTPPAATAAHDSASALRIRALENALDGASSRAHAAESLAAHAHAAAAEAHASARAASADACSARAQLVEVSEALAHFERREAAGWAAAAGGSASAAARVAALEADLAEERRRRAAAERAAKRAAAELDASADGAPSPQSASGRDCGRDSSGAPASASGAAPSAPPSSAALSVAGTAPGGAGGSDDDGRSVRSSVCVPSSVAATAAALAAQCDAQAAELARSRSQLAAAAAAFQSLGAPVLLRALAPPGGAACGAGAAAAQRLSARALASLAAAGDAAQAELLSAGAVPALVALIRRSASAGAALAAAGGTGSPGEGGASGSGSGGGGSSSADLARACLPADGPLCAAAAGALANLAMSGTGAAALAACGGVSALAALAEGAGAAASARPRDAAPLLRAAAGAVANAFGAADAATRAALADGGALRLLVGVAADAARADGDGDADGAAAAGDALCHVARGLANACAAPCAPATAAALLNAGGVPLLLAIVAAPSAGDSGTGSARSSGLSSQPSLASAASGGAAPATPPRPGSRAAGGRAPSPTPSSGGAGALAPAAEESMSGGVGGGVGGMNGDCFETSSAVSSGSSCRARAARGALPANVPAPAAAKRHAAAALAALARDPCAARAVLAAGGLQALSLLASCATRDDVARLAQRALAALHDAEAAARSGSMSPPDARSSSEEDAAALQLAPPLALQSSGGSLGRRSGVVPPLLVPDSPPRGARASLGFGSVFSTVGPASPGGGLSLGSMWGADAPRRRPPVAAPGR
jgi:hypothetical protein